jgi:hypothetical protein
LVRSIAVATLPWPSQVVSRQSGGTSLASTIMGRSTVAHTPAMQALTVHGLGGGGQSAAPVHSGVTVPLELELVDVLLLVAPPLPGALVDVVPPAPPVSTTCDVQPPAEASAAPSNTETSPPTLRRAVLILRTLATPWRAGKAARASLIPRQRSCWYALPRCSPLPSS